MPKKRDPIVSVLRFFETAELPVAEIALALAKDLVSRRRPPVEKAKPRKRKPATTTATPAAAPTPAPATTTTATAAPPPPPAGARPVPPRKPALKEEDRPLPGMVGEVGEH